MLGLPPRASTTSRAGGVGGLQSGAGVDEDGVEDHHGGEEPHGGRLVAEDPGEQREEGDERGGRHEDDDRDRHAGEELHPRGHQRRGQPHGGADDERDRRRPERRRPWPRRTRRATRRCPPTPTRAAGRRCRRCRPARSTPTRPSPARRPGRRTRRPRRRSRRTGCSSLADVRGSRRSSSRTGVASAIRLPAEQGEGEQPDAGAQQRGRPQLLWPARLHGGDQQHAEPARGAVPLPEDGAGQRRRCGQLEPVGDRRPRRRELHQPHALEPARTQDRGHVVGGGRRRAQARPSSR